MLAPAQIRARGEKLHTALDVVIEERSWSTPKRRAHQWRTLKKLVQHAFEHVPLYQRLFAKNCFKPDMLEDWDDLQKLPLLTKDELRGRPEADLHSLSATASWSAPALWSFSQAEAPSKAPEARRTPGRSRDDVRWLASSGSTGIPAKIARSETSLWHYMAWNTALFFDWCDGQPLTNSLYLVDFAPDSIDFAAADLLRTTVPDSRLFSVHDPVSKLTEKALSISPEFISSYPSTLRAFALELGSRIIAQTKLIHLTSEMLDAHTRHLLRQVFPNAKLIETYTSTEGGLVAFQCTHDARWHIAETNVIAEIVDEEGKPTEGLGNLVITDLTNDATPILRYRGLGDLARWETSPCPCGSTLRSIRQLEGRSAAMLRTRSGVLLSPFVITNAIEEVGGLAHYQVVQKLPGSFEVRVVATHGTPPFQIERDIKSVLSAAVANDADLIVNFVPKIAAPHGSHKVPLVISELPLAA
ncbi:phenylacetate--CoA ligase family protein [Prosthecobacter sp.]|jgi:phenylacetate-CoA ligase|uniref:phenylacetate--CoA ligase family protein n=1 Tax=Prosthecobacter sp. TaxID=1965333 RepID=UPI003784844F